MIYEKGQNRSHLMNIFKITLFTRTNSNHDIGRQIINDIYTFFYILTFMSNLKSKLGFVLSFKLLHFLKFTIHSYYTNFMY